MIKGKLLVIDGGDGSGKTVQTKLLTDYLTRVKIPYQVYDFPRYYSSFFGQTVGRLLSGEFGPLSSISPYLASLVFAFDRASVREEMQANLDKGEFIICNRYVTSNMAHQGARFDSLSAQKRFLNWLSKLEYKINKLPKENMVIYLYVPWKIGLELTLKKADRQYIKGAKLDILEKDIDYRKKVEKMYLRLCQKNKHWYKINCVEDGTLLSKQKIHQKIVALLEAVDFFARK